MRWKKSLRNIYSFQCSDVRRKNMNPGLRVSQVFSTFRIRATTAWKSGSVANDHCLAGRMGERCHIGSTAEKRSILETRKACARCSGKLYTFIGVEQLAPSLLNILRKSLTQVEQSVSSVDNDPAVVELRKHVARSFAELELIKSERRDVARKMFLVSPRPYRPGETTNTSANSSHLQPELVRSDHD